MDLLGLFVDPIYRLSLKIGALTLGSLVRLIRRMEI